MEQSRDVLTKARAELGQAEFARALALETPVGLENQLGQLEQSLPRAPDPAEKDAAQLPMASPATVPAQHSGWRLLEERTGSLNAWHLVPSGSGEP